MHSSPHCYALARCALPIDIFASSLLGVSSRCCLAPSLLGNASLPAAASRWPFATALPLAVASRCCRSGSRGAVTSSAQTSASLHPPAALRLRVLPFTRAWTPTVCAEEFPTPLEMSLHGLHMSTGLLLLRHSKSIGPSAPIAYATSVSSPDEAVAWPGTQVLRAG